VKRRGGGLYVDDKMKKVRRVGELRVVLLRAIKGAEGVVVPDVPSDFDLGIDALDCAVNFTINFLLAVSPELLPRQDLRIVQKQSPERHEVSIARTLIVPRGAHKFIQFNQALSRPFDGNAALSSFLAAMLAEARDRRSSSEPAVM